MTTSIPHTFRDATDGDKAFVHDSWLKSARLLGSYIWAPPSLYTPSLRAAITWWLPALQIECAVNPEDETQVIGWAARAADVTHYVYVKHPWRQAGLGRAIFERGKVTAYTHHPRVNIPWLRGAYRPDLFWSDDAVAYMIRVRKGREA